VKEVEVLFIISLWEGDGTHWENIEGGGILTASENPILLNGKALLPIFAVSIARKTVLPV
jgi:hypothetical protein